MVLTRSISLNTKTNGPAHEILVFIAYASGKGSDETAFAACTHSVIFTFTKQAFNESLDFANVHSLMKDINLIDSCQAHLPMQ